MFWKKKYQFTKSDVKDLLYKANDSFENSKFSTPKYKLDEISDKLVRLEDALNNNDFDSMNLYARDISDWVNDNRSRKSIFLSLIGEISIIGITAYVLCSFVNISMVPTGSMRPTIQEYDRVLLLKSSFNLRPLWFKSPLVFDETSIKRGMILSWMDRARKIRGALFSFMKTDMEMLKRCVALPGDRIYFNNGYIHIVDKEGNERKDFLEFQKENKLFYCPFNSSDFRFWKKDSKRLVSGGILDVYHLFNKPIFSVERNEIGSYEIEWLRNNLNVENNLSVAGSENYGMAKIISLDKARSLGYKGIEDTKYLICIAHHPKVCMDSLYNNPKPKFLYSFIPLNKNILDNVFKSMDTARLSVNNKSIKLWSSKGFGFEKSEEVPNAIDLENGVYEFRDGRLFKLNIIDPTFGVIPILSVAYSKEISPEIIKHDEKNALILFNYGLSGSNSFDKMANENIMPNRYIAFREDGIYIGKNKLVDSSSKEYSEFIKMENDKSLVDASYQAFLPYENNTEDIAGNGIMIPDECYLMMGDNTSSSADSRTKGAIHKDDIEGKAIYNLSALNVLNRSNPRNLTFNQPKASKIGKLYTIISIAIIISIIAIPYILNKGKYKHPIFKKRNK